MNQPLDGLMLPPDARLGPNCGVIAVAVAAGISYAHAWSLLKAQGGKSGRWKGRTTEADRNAVLERLGVKLLRVACPVRRRLSTVARRLRPGCRYIIRTTGHVQIVRDGIVIDQMGPRPIADYALANKLVTSIYRIEE